MPSTAPLAALLAPALLSLCALPVLALQDPAPPEAPQQAAEPEKKPPREDPETIVITPGRSPERQLDAPYSTAVVGEQEIEQRAYRTTPEALRYVPGVLVQETSHGQGSPYIRGFTSYHNLFLIDGIRLNNSVFRPGPNQYWNTVDASSVERFEIVKGPSSVLYGSDAIGGTVNAITKSPYAWDSDSGFAGEITWRVKDGENSHHARAEWSGAFGDTGFLLGLTRKDFGDVEGGRDIGEQPNTGYDEWDGDAKVETWLADDVRLVVAHQRVELNEVPRTHSTRFAKSFEGTSVGSDQKRDLEQDRDLSYVQLHADELDGAFDSLTMSFSYQRQSEVEDRIRSSGARRLQGFDVDTTGFFTHLASEGDLGRWTYGLDFYHDEVDSFRDNGEDQTAADQIQGAVADDASYDMLGVFVQDAFRVTDPLELVLGVRFDYASADADSVRDPVTDERIAIEETWNEVVGSARFTYDLTPQTWRLFGGVSQGFRAPNLSDLTRFDSARSNEFEIPSPDLDPEHYLSYEVGVKTGQEEWSAEAALFYTDIRDAIIRFPTGNTNAAGEFEVSKANAGDGEVYGVELGASWRFAEAWTVFGNATWLDGSLSEFPDSTQQEESDTLSRLMPPTVHAGLRWEGPSHGLWAEGIATFADDADDLSRGDQADTQRIPPGGTPGYVVLSLYGGREITQGVDLTLGVENVADEDYRVHGSGTNMPGRSFLIGIRASF